MYGVLTSISFATLSRTPVFAYFTVKGALTAPRQEALPPKTAGRLGCRALSRPMRTARRIYFPRGSYFLDQALCLKGTSTYQGQMIVLEEGISVVLMSGGQPQA